MTKRNRVHVNREGVIWVEQRVVIGEVKSIGWEWIARSVDGEVETAGADRQDVITDFIHLAEAHGLLVKGDEPIDMP